MLYFLYMVIRLPGRKDLIISHVAVVLKLLLHYYLLYYYEDV